MDESENENENGRRRRETLPALSTLCSSDGRHTAKVVVFPRPANEIEKECRNADIEAKARRGETPLTEAAQSGNEKTVLLLLAHGADIDARNNSGGSILQETASRGYCEIVQILLENGAAVDDASLKDKTTGLDRAIRGG
ncbi:hypothetical protein OEA41_004703 [Lepraria neglecta]|uniref:Ankyrin n=1 Tax=Lepraria neglecta TaxID=209136 RepID=A0AAD9Z0S9_9LECA|nr:hypothetical protein OEA41_004703 [Lepraria neglecta]